MEQLLVRTTKNVNLHSASKDGGIVHVPANVPTLVPADVTDHPAFGWLKADGDLKILKKFKQAVPIESESKPVPPPAPVFEEDDDDDEHEHDHEDEDEHEGEDE